MKEVVIDRIAFMWAPGPQGYILWLKEKDGARAHAVLIDVRTVMSVVSGLQRFPTSGRGGTHRGQKPVDFVAETIETMGGKPVRVEIRAKQHSYDTRVVVKVRGKEERIRFSIEEALAFAARHKVPLLMAESVFSAFKAIQELFNSNYTSRIWPFADLTPPTKNSR